MSDPMQPWVVKASGTTHTTGLGLAEGPFWDRDRAQLSWVDIDQGRLCVSDGRTVRSAQFPGSLGAAVPVSGGAERWILANGDRIALASIDGEFETLWQGKSCCEYGRFNDAQCDPWGRFFAGRICTAGHHSGDLLRVDDDGTVEAVIDDVALANGMAWSPDGREFYFIDSKNHVVSVYEYDAVTARPSRSRVLHRFPDSIEPDGLSLDALGNLWVATWGGSEVVVLRPDGQVDDRIEIGHRFVTSCAFGGAGLDRLFITVAADEESGQPGMIGLAASGVPGRTRQSFVLR